MAESPKYYPERAKESHQISKSAESFRSYQKTVIDQIRDQRPTKDLLTHLEGLTSTPQTVDQVLALQILLYRLGFNSKQNIDGIYGNKNAKNSRTMDAVRAFQKAYNKEKKGGLVEDGWFGPKTLEALKQWITSIPLLSSKTSTPSSPLPKSGDPTSTVSKNPVSSPSPVPLTSKTQNFVQPPTSSLPTSAPLPLNNSTPSLEKPSPDPLERELATASFGAKFYRPLGAKTNTPPSLHLTWEIGKLRTLSQLAIKSTRTGDVLSIPDLQVGAGDYLFSSAYTKEKLVEKGYIRKEPDGQYTLDLIFHSATKKVFVRKVKIQE